MLELDRYNCDLDAILNIRCVRCGKADEAGVNPHCAECAAKAQTVAVPRGLLVDIEKILEQFPHGDNIRELVEQGIDYYPCVICGGMGKVHRSRCDVATVLADVGKLLDDGPQYDESA
jgi:hypothetical protein